MSPRGSKQRKHAPSLKSPRPASFVRAGSSVASLRTMGILEPMMKSAAENGMQGFLEKRGGGRHAPGRAASWLSGFAPWQKRFFVLLPSAQGEEQQRIYYYDSAEAYRAFAEPQGELDLHGATVDLAKVSGDFFDPDGELHLHFTLRTTDRELHLRIMEGSRISEYEAWLKALAAAGVTILEGAVKRHLLTSSTFKALQVQLELRRKDDERTLRQVAGLSPAASVTSSLTGSMKDLFKLGTPTPPPSSVEPLDIAQLDSALERSRVSGVHPRVIQQAKLRRSASMGSGKFGGALGDGSSPHPMPGSMPSSSGGSSSGDAAAPPKRTNEQLMMDTYNSWGCSAQSCAVM